MHLLCATHTLAPLGALSAQIPTLRDRARLALLFNRTDGLTDTQTGRASEKEKEREREREGEGEGEGERKRERCLLQSLLASFGSTSLLNPVNRF